MGGGTRGPPGRHSRVAGAVRRCEPPPPGHGLCLRPPAGLTPAEEIRPRFVAGDTLGSRSPSRRMPPRRQSRGRPKEAQNWLIWLRTRSWPGQFLRAPNRQGERGRRARRLSSLFVDPGDREYVDYRCSRAQAQPRTCSPDGNRCTWPTARRTPRSRVPALCNICHSNATQSKEVFGSIFEKRS
jgi:hypothetical protein